MKANSNDVLNTIKQLYKLNKQPLDLNLIHNSIKHTFKDTKPSEIGKMLKYLHQSGKIEMIGDKIRSKSD
jgi:predicted aldo/keto reductase-like oxidoreductase